MIKSIEGYEGYFVSDEGEVFSNKSGTMRKLATYISSSGYENVDLFQDGKKHKKQVHRLVGIAFIPNPRNKPQIDHKDDVKTHNKAFNLEWCTAKENVRKSFKTMSPVRNFIECYAYRGDNLLGEFKSIISAARYLSNNFGLKMTMIHKHKKYKGFSIVRKV